VNGTVGVGNLSMSALLSRLKAFQLPWSTGLIEHRAFAVETYFKNNDSVLTQRIFRRHFNINVSLVVILLPLRITQEQGVRKETKHNGGFETEHQGRRGSNFSQHAATSDAELPEMLGGMY
jgi:hypothetical protein